MSSHVVSVSVSVCVHLVKTLHKVKLFSKGQKSYRLCPLRLAQPAAAFVSLAQSAVHFFVHLYLRDSRCVRSLVTSIVDFPLTRRRRRRSAPHDEIQFVFKDFLRRTLKGKQYFKYEKSVSQYFNMQAKQLRINKLFSHMCNILKEKHKEKCIHCTPD